MAEAVPCPQCGSNDVKRVGYTWWGGALGPRILNHTKCNACGTTYNGKTGRSNTGGIVLYTVVLLVLAIVLVLVVYSVIGSM